MCLTNASMLLKPSIPLSERGKPSIAKKLALLRKRRPTQSQMARDRKSVV
jgi:hypothetical protein